MGNLYGHMDIRILSRNGVLEMLRSVLSGEEFDGYEFQVSGPYLPLELHGGNKRWLLCEWLDCRYMVVEIDLRDIERMQHVGEVVEYLRGRIEAAVAELNV